MQSFRINVGDFAGKICWSGIPRLMRMGRGGRKEREREGGGEVENWATWNGEKKRRTEWIREIRGLLPASLPPTIPKRGGRRKRKRKRHFFCSSGVYDH